MRRIKLTVTDDTGSDHVLGRIDASDDPDALVMCDPFQPDVEDRWIFFKTMKIDKMSSDPIG